MKNLKKLSVSTLVVLMLFAFSTTTLVGCEKDNAEIVSQQKTDDDTTAIGKDETEDPDDRGN